MKNILVTTDFSVISLNAVKYAADMARVCHAKLSLLHVCIIPVAFSEVPYPERDIEKLLEEATRELAKLRSALKLRTANKIEIGIAARVGGFVAETENYCEEIDPTVVVIGAQGSTAIERAFFGSNALNAIRNISWPLIIVPPRVTFAGIKNVGLACDLKEVDTTVPFQDIISLAKDFKAKLHVLHVTSGERQGITTGELEQTRLLESLLHDLDPIYHFFNDFDIEQSLARFAENNDIDLLIIVPKKHNLLSQLLQKGHTKAMMMHTHVPLMALHE